jgi:hypothetical protein
MHLFKILLSVASFAATFVEGYPLNEEEPNRACGWGCGFFFVCDPYCGRPPGSGATGRAPYTVTTPLGTIRMYELGYLPGFRDHPFGARSTYVNISPRMDGHNNLSIHWEQHDIPAGTVQVVMKCHFGEDPADFLGSWDPRRQTTGIINVPAAQINEILRVRRTTGGTYRVDCEYELR